MVWTGEARLGWRFWKGRRGSHGFARVWLGLVGLAVGQGLGLVSRGPASRGGPGLSRWGEAAQGEPVGDRCGLAWLAPQGRGEPVLARRGGAGCGLGEASPGGAVKARLG